MKVFHEKNYSRKIIFKFIFGFSSLIFSDASFAGDMDPGTCAPSGIINIAKEKMDPRGFWARMYSDSLMGIETLSGQRTDEQWDGPEAQCMINNRSGSLGYKKCMMEMRNMLDYHMKCNRHAQTLCRINGGRC